MDHTPTFHLRRLVPDDMMKLYRWRTSDDVNRHFTVQNISLKTHEKWFAGALENRGGIYWVAEEKGFLDAAQDAPLEIIPDYVFPGLSNEAMATIVAGIIGSLIVFGVALGVTYLRRRRPSAAYEV